MTGYDFFQIDVYNLDTPSHEVYRIYADEISGLCGSVISFPLDDDYSNANVRVRISKSSLATATMYVDNVAFFGY